jgi:hypothetical protein
MKYHLAYKYHHSGTFFSNFNNYLCIHLKFILTGFGKHGSLNSQFIPIKPAGHTTVDDDDVPQ